jgi:hypothetical protein
MDWWYRHIGRCLWVLGGGCKRFGVNWLRVGRTMRVYCFGRGASSWLDGVFGRFLLHAKSRTRGM